MNQKDLMAAIVDGVIAKEEAINQKQVKLVLDQLEVVISHSLEQENEVALGRLGKFKIAKRPARTGRNPRTGAEITIPEKTVVRFTPGKYLRDLFTV